MMTLSNPVSLTAALRALIAGALQRTENITGTIITRYGGTGTLAGITPQLGELVINTDLGTLLHGDGSTLGGLSFTPNFNTGATIWVGPTGSNMALSGSALNTAYTAAKALRPYGNDKSTTNRDTLVILPGWYDINSLGADIALDTEFVDVIGVGGPGAVTIFGGTRAFNQTANDVRIRGITFYREGSGKVFKIGGSTHAATLHEDLIFAQTSGVSIVDMMSYATFTNFDGTYRRIRGVCVGGAQNRVIGIYGGWGSGFTCNAVFEDCEGAAHCFGMGSSAIASAFVSFTGRHTRCRISTDSTATGNLNPYAGAVIEDGFYKCGLTNSSIFRVVVAGGDSPIFRRCTILGNGTGNAIERTGSETTATLTASHLMMGANGINSNLTNKLGTNAAAFNIADANVTG
jgi:hypothetical protein